jgi:hypothetical protein
LELSWRSSLGKELWLETARVILHRRWDTKWEKPTNATATARTEWIGISSSDDGCAECDTSREWIEVSLLTPFCVSMVWSGLGVVDACSLRILFTRKMPDATKNAIGMPETQIEEYSLEIAGRVGHTPIWVRLGHFSRYANLSECWHSVQRAG